MIRVRLTVLALAALLVTAAVPDCMAQAQAGASAMACCRSMPCTPANHSHDCCKKMVQVPVVFSLAPTRTHGPGPLVEIAMVPVMGLAAHTVTLAQRSDAAQHSPPGELVTLHQPLRI